MSLLRGLLWSLLGISGTPDRDNEEAYRQSWKVQRDKGDERETFNVDLIGARMALDLNGEEVTLIEQFRTMRADDRRALMHIAQSMSERVEATDKPKPKGYGK